MDELKQLLVLNHNNLDRLRVRSTTCRAKLQSSKNDSRTLYGPYAAYWDEWYEEAESIVADLRSDIAATAHFATELREFIALVDAETEPHKATELRIQNMQKLAKEAVLCQKDMLSITDERIAEHKAFTHKLLLVEAIDNLDE
jgi:hypothetical protein